MGFICFQLHQQQCVWILKSNLVVSMRSDAEIAEQTSEETVKRSNYHLWLITKNVSSQGSHTAAIPLLSDEMCETTGHVVQGREDRTIGKRHHSNKLSVLHHTDAV